MSERAYRLFLRWFGRLPPSARRLLVRWGSPNYTLGTICFVMRADGAILFVRHTYHERWGTPGGLAQRGEMPDAAVVRETAEEVNLAVELVGEPVMTVNPKRGWVDAVYLARPAPGVPLDDVRPSSPEVSAVGWFTLDELPDLQADAANGLAALSRVGRLDLMPSSGRQRR